MKNVKNNKSFLIPLLAFLFICVISCSSNNSQSQKGRDASIIAKDACQGVGIVGKTSRGSKGAPILILEENHASRAGQIQHAITLVRLHERYGLKHIALEGYLKERSKITTDWWITATQNLNPEAKERVAVRLLKEGEISSAEFLKLIYNDISLYPVETTTEYPVGLDEKSYLAPLLYLLKIAEQSIREEHMPKLKQLTEDFKQLEKGDNKELVEKKRKEIFDYILSVDSWAQAKAKALQDVDVIMPEDQQLAMVEEIVNRAEKLSLKFEPEEKEAMEQYLEFFRKRIKASKTMSLSAGTIADQPDVSVVVTVVGAAHTEGMCSMLSSAGRPYAVIRPLALENRNKKGDIPWSMFERKYKRLSVYSKGFTEILLRAFPPSGNMKPEPVLSESWFQGKAELYLFTERIAGGVLGPPSPPGGGKPPYGFKDDDFRGKWVFIDPRRISIISDTKEGKGRAVLFPAVLNPNDGKRRTEIWVKAGLGTAVITSQERKSLESMLRKALEEVISEKELSKKVEDNAGRVQITLNTLASFAETPQAVRKVVLGTI
jgi:peptidyl-tRNA hydrolase